MTDREVMQMALEALDAYSWEQVDAARTTLRARLAEPEPEPVAWRYKLPSGKLWHFTPHGPHEFSKRGLGMQPLYTTPPTRSPLTVEEIDNICRQSHGGADPQEWARNFVRAVEAAHGIKEER